MLVPWHIEDDFILTVLRPSALGKMLTVCDNYVWILTCRSMLVNHSVLSLHVILFKSTDCDFEIGVKTTEFVSSYSPVAHRSCGERKVKVIIGNNQQIIVK